VKLEGRLHRVRNSNARAVLVLASQGVSALSALLLELIAARKLGASGLGKFTVLWAVLVFYNSAQTGWLGDALTVLPRFEPTVRRALFRYQGFILGLALLVGTAAAIAVGAGSFRTAVLFGVALAAWVAEETGRRLFLARLEFGELLLNDTIYAVVATIVASAFVSSSKHFSLDDLFIAMIVASLVSIVAAFVRLPKDEFRRAERGHATMRAVAGFGAYRAAQISIRPLALLAMGWLVLAAAGAGAEGRLEVGRLIVAPAITLVNGAGAALLPLFRHELDREREGVPGHEGGMRKLLIESTVLLGIGTAILCIGALALAPQLAHFLTDGKFRVNSLAVLAWGLFAIAFGLGVPAGNAAVAQGRAKQAFWIRVADSVVGLSLAAVFVAVASSWAPPLGLAIGATLGMIWLLVVVLRGEDRVPDVVALRV
jgi:O-antigen/teichoic acid export membrane protein